MRASLGGVVVRVLELGSLLSAAGERAPGGVQFFSCFFFLFRSIIIAIYFLKLIIIIGFSYNYFFLSWVNFFPCVGHLPESVVV